MCAEGVRVFSHSLQGSSGEDRETEGRIYQVRAIPQETLRGCVFRHFGGLYAPEGHARLRGVRPQIRRARQFRGFHREAHIRQKPGQASLHFGGCLRF